MSATALPTARFIMHPPSEKRARKPASAPSPERACDRILGSLQPNSDLRLNLA